MDKAERRIEMDSIEALREVPPCKVKFKSPFPPHPPIPSPTRGEGALRKLAGDPPASLSQSLGGGRRVTL